MVDLCPPLGPGFATWTRSPCSSLAGNSASSRGTPNLKFIATRSTGFDHIDLDACLKRGIVVSNVPSYGENTVAEHTMALLLMMSRKVHQSVLQVRSGRVDLAELTGFDLQGRRLA